MTVAPTTLLGRLTELVDTLDQAELNDLRLLLGMAAGRLAPSEEVGSSPSDALRTTLACLARLRSDRGEVSADGVLFHGWPDWLPADLLASLIDESYRRRPDARLYERQRVSCGGAIADELANSSELLDFVRHHAMATAEPTGVASYLYYDSPGMGISAHVDTEVFSLNVIMLLVHERAGADPGSQLIVHPPDSEPVPLALAPGEIVLLDANAVVHGRSQVTGLERVHVLTIGFTPTNQSPFAL
ncbi:MAG TPA: hypothetical protein VJ851_04215 [Jatrophihabitans sp.]|nr:hypothetical protein [Jatrophihabitans sp.]